MARLSSKERDRLPASSFGEPAERKYPMPDKSHAANAKARASQAVKAGRMSAGEQARIDRKADQKMGKPHVGRGHTNVRNPNSHADKLKHV